MWASDLEGAMAAARSAVTSAGGLLRVIQSKWTGSRAVRLKAKAAHRVLAVTEVG
jgi:hypothetical protein